MTPFTTTHSRHRLPLTAQAPTSDGTGKSHTAQCSSTQTPARRSALTRLACLMLSALALLTWSGCEVSGAGDLDGFWYLTRLDTLATGGRRNMDSTSVSWAFQTDLMQMVDYCDPHSLKEIVMARYRHADGLLTVFSPFVYDRMAGDRTIEGDSCQRLAQYGINAVPDTFCVERLSRHRMQVADRTLRLYFEKR